MSPKSILDQRIFRDHISNNFGRPEILGVTGIPNVLSYFHFFYKRSQRSRKIFTYPNAMARSFHWWSGHRQDKVLVCSVFIHFYILKVIIYGLRDDWEHFNGEKNDWWQRFLWNSWFIIYIGYHFINNNNNHYYFWDNFSKKIINCETRKEHQRFDRCSRGKGVEQSL